MSSGKSDMITGIVVGVLVTVLSTALFGLLGRLGHISIYRLLGGHVELNTKDVGVTATSVNPEATLPAGVYDLCMLKQVTIQVDPVYDPATPHGMGSCTLTWDKDNNIWGVDARVDQPKSSTGGTTCVASCANIK